jgi:hypothetical protein
MMTNNSHRFAQVILMGRPSESCGTCHYLSVDRQDLEVFCFENEGDVTWDSDFTPIGADTPQGMPGSCWCALWIPKDTF